MPQVIVNPNNGLAESYDDPTQASDLLAQGYHVPLHDANGNPFSATAQDASNLIATGGYRLPDANELASWLETSKYSSPTEQAKAFIEGAGEGALGPLAPSIEKMMGADEHSMQMRSSLHPGTKLAGQLASAGALTLASGGLFGEGAAAIAAKSLPGIIGKASKAAEAGIGLTGTFGNVARGLTQGAIESGLYQASHELSENLIGNTDMFSEHALADVGIASLIGASLGGAVGAGKLPFSKVGKSLEKLEGFIPKAQVAREAITDSAANLSTLPTSVPFKMINLSPKTSFMETLKKSAKDVDLGDIYHVFRSPKSALASQVLSIAQKFSTQKIKELVPQHAAQVSALLNTFKSGLNTLVNIERQSAGLFGFGAFEAAKPLINRKELEDIYDRTNEIEMDPSRLADYLQKATEPFAEHMPNTSVSLAKSTNNAIQYLQSQKPNLKKSAPLDKEAVPNALDIAKFNQTATILNNPLSIYPYIKEGSVTLDQIKALKTVYPNVLQSIQKETMRNLLRYQSDSKTILPMKTRLGLSRLFVQNMDSSLTHLLRNQTALQGMNMANQAAAQATRPSKTGMSRMKSSQNEQTKAQQSVERTAS